MARARWIKPEFFTDARVCAVSDQAALVFAALWVEADDGGVAPGDPRDIYGRRFIKRGSWAVEQVANAMGELSEAGLIHPFEHRGEPFLLLPDFARKQGIKPKEWRHLGKEHDTVTNRVLSETNAVRLAFTPKPLAVAEAVAEAETTTTLVGLKPNRKAVARTYQAIQAHLAETLALVKNGQRERLAADEMRGIQAELVFAYWQAKCGHERALLDDKRLIRLKRCLQENGGNVHELLYAVDGWGKDGTFQRLADQDNRKLDGIDNIFRDRERIERLAGHSKAWRTEQAPHPMALKYLEGADVPAHQ